MLITTLVVSFLDRCRLEVRCGYHNDARSNKHQTNYFIYRAYTQCEIKTCSFSVNSPECDLYDFLSSKSNKLKKIDCSQQDGRAFVQTLIYGHRHVPYKKKHTHTKKERNRQTHKTGSGCWQLLFARHSNAMVTYKGIWRLLAACLLCHPWLLMAHLRLR